MKLLYIGHISCNSAESNYRFAVYTMNNGDRQFSRGLIESFAGFVAGIASVRCRYRVQMLLLICQTLVAHPLDVIKTRLQGKALSQFFYHIPILKGENLGQLIGRHLHASGARCDWYKESSAMKGPSMPSTGALHLISSATP